MLGAGYLRSDNGSEGYALTFNLAFLDNRWSIGATYLDADIDYDLITSFGDVPINQKGELIKVKLMYGITPDFHLGISARYLESTIGSSNPIFPNLPSNIQLPNGFSTTGIGLLADYSTVDDKIYPTPVFNLAFSSTYNEPSGRFGEDYVKSILTYDTYLPTRDTGVVAMRLVGCSAPGRVPFYDLCSLGGTDAFRGFNITQFLDNALLSTQIEYRKRLGKRIGVVAFGGVGAVGGGLWVTSERLNRRTCPSESCGVVGQLFFREGVTVHEERDGCAEGMSQREAARHSCPPLTLKKAQ